MHRVEERTKQIGHFADTAGCVEKFPYRYELVPIKKDVRRSNKEVLNFHIAILMERVDFRMKCRVENGFINF